MLFAIEAAIKIRNSQTVTQEKAYWMLPSANQTDLYSRLCDIDFSSAKGKKRKSDAIIKGDQTSSGDVLIPVIVDSD